MMTVYGKGERRKEDAASKFRRLTKQGSPDGDDAANRWAAFYLPIYEEAL
jgi:hypothetical protein